MRGKKFIKFGWVAAILLLGSCTYGHEITFSLRNGKLVFTFDDGNPIAVERVSIVELSSDARTIWELESVDYNGRDLGELEYGAVPSGMKQTTAAKPLRVGQLYRAELATVDGGGSEEFVISPDPANGQRNDAIIVRE